MTETPITEANRELVTSVDLIDPIFPHLPVPLISMVDCFSKLLKREELITVGKKVEYRIDVVGGKKIITLEGTADWNDIQDDLETWQEPITLSMLQAKVFKGVADQYRLIKQTLLTERPAAIQGHSLAGGTALLACADLHIPALVYGCPRVGNKHFANRVAPLAGRIHHRGDNVSYLPWRWWLTWHKPWINRYSHGQIKCLRVGEQKNTIIADIDNTEHKILSYVNALYDCLATAALAGKNPPLTLQA